MNKLALIAAMQFICTEYRLDEKGPALAEPELFRAREEPIMQRQTGETVGTECPKPHGLNGTMERLSNGDVKPLTE